jgi:hypothetical protein
MQLLENDHRNVLMGVLRDYGIEDRKSVSSEAKLTPATPAYSAKRLTFSLLSPKAISRKTLPAHPKWLTQRGNNASAGSLTPPKIFEDRRPSLPIIQTARSSGSSVHLPWVPRQWSPQLSVDKSLSPSPPPSTAALPSTIADTVLEVAATADNPEIIRMTVNDYMLLLRYSRLSSESDWYFGHGRRHASAILASLEEIAMHRGFPETVVALQNFRPIYHLPVPPSILIVGSAGAGETDARQAVPNTTASEESPQLYRQRDSSFDLDQYLADITPGVTDAEDDTSIVLSNQLTPNSGETARPTSLGADSLLSINTGRSRAESRLSDFSIREARKEWPSSVPATAFTLDDGIYSSPDSFSSNASPSIGSGTLGVDLGHEQHPMPPGAGTQIILPMTPPVHGSTTCTPMRRHPREFASLTFANQLISPPLSVESTPLKRDFQLTSSTPADLRNRRQANRRCAILDGEQVSPCGLSLDLEKLQTDTDETFFDSDSSGYFTQSSTSGSSDSSPAIPRRGSSLARRFRSIPFFILLSLFELPTSGTGLSGRRGLSLNEVETILMTAVDAESQRTGRLDEVEKQNLSWMIEQVAVMVS